jgi:putative transposase
MVRSKAIHIALGARADGRKEVLGLWIEQNEGAKFWLRVMNELKNRAVDAKAAEVAHFWALIKGLPDIKTGPVKPAAPQLIYGKKAKAEIAAKAVRRFGRQCLPKASKP